MAETQPDRDYCEGQHDEMEHAPYAVAAMSITNSDSAANLTYVCAQCLGASMTEWAEDPDDVDGWFIQRVTEDAR